VNIITEEFYPGYLTEKKSILFKKDYQHFLLVSLFCLFVFKKRKRKRKGRKNIAMDLSALLSVFVFLKSFCFP